MSYSEHIESYITRLNEVLNKLDRNEIDRFAEILMEAYQKESTIYVFGNGGSASTATHFANDLNKGVSYGLDKRFKMIALTDNVAYISALANDVGYEDIFIEQLKNFIKEGDVIIGISGSGNSKNIIKAIEFAKSRGNTTIGITGYNGGKLKQLAHHSVNAMVDDMQISEDIHMILVHIMMKVTRKAITGSETYL